MKLTVMVALKATAPPGGTEAPFLKYSMIRPGLFLLEWIRWDYLEGPAKPLTVNSYTMKYLTLLIPVLLLFTCQRESLVSTEEKAKADIFTSEEATSPGTQKIVILEASNPEYRPTYLMESNGIIFRHRNEPLLMGAKALRDFHDGIRKAHGPQLGIRESVDILLGEYQSLTTFIIKAPDNKEREEAAAEAIRSIFSLDMRPVEFEILAHGLLAAQEALPPREYQQYKKYVENQSRAFLKEPKSMGLDDHSIIRLRLAAQNARDVLSK